jgi:hypothetical protein
MDTIKYTTMTDEYIFGKLQGWKIKMLLVGT